MRKTCIHNIVLPSGLRCDHGYIQVFLRRQGHTFCKNLGIHTKASQEDASILVAQKKKEFRESIIGILPQQPSKRFSEVAYLWFNLWQKERNSDGTEAHNQESCYKVKWTLDKVLVPRFGKQTFEQIRSVDIHKWRQEYTDRGLSGTTANRYQAILSSIFSHVDKWIKTERIKPGFRVPVENPCFPVEMAPAKKRERILSKYEASKLKMAFLQLNDPDGWEICKMALKSVLSMKDLKALDIGSEINTVRSKTQVSVNLPITVIAKLNFFGWRTRWKKAREIAGLKDVQFRDLRKTGGNVLLGKHDLKLISQYMGHASIKTTEQAYMLEQNEKMVPLVNDLNKWVEEL